MVGCEGQAGEVGGDGDPIEFRLTRPQLVRAVEAALREYFFDGLSVTLGQFEVDWIIGKTILNASDEVRAAIKLPCAMSTQDH